MSQNGSAAARLAPPRRRASRLRAVVLAGGRLAIGTLACLAPLTSLLAAGWLARVQARQVAVRWHQRSSAAMQEFSEFAAAETASAPLARWPGWVAQTGPLTDIATGRRMRRSARRLLGGLLANARMGVLSLANTWVATMPACALWLLAWWGGWENSFNKGYEQHWVGPSVFACGTGLFALTMTHVPLAQARQAITGDWRAFYDYRLIRSVARARWLGCLAIAVLHLLAAAPVMALKVLPMRLDALIGDFATLTDVEIAQAAQHYYLLASAVLLLTLIGLRSVTARVYADGLLAAIRDGAVSASELRPAERAILQRLDLLRVAPGTDRHPLVVAVRWLGTRGARVGAFALSLAMWAAFVFQLVLAQFINHAWVGWISHPLVHLPWLWQGP